MEKKVSIVSSVYNKASWLDRFFKSIINEQYPIACPQCRQLNKRQDLLMCDYHLYEYKNIAFDAGFILFK